MGPVSAYEHVPTAVLDFEEQTTLRIASGRSESQHIIRLGVWSICFLA